MTINVAGARHTITITRLDKGSGRYGRAASISLRR
jgi:hypothetical protein